MNKHLAAVAIASVLSVAGLTSAQAAPPGFCDQYAHAAENQVRGALANPRCAREIQGARWSSDFRVHYDWCLGASFEAANGERNARTEFIRRCR